MLRIKTLLTILTYLVVVLGVIPLFPWLDAPVQFSAVGAFCAGLLAERRQRYLMGPRLATVLTFAFFAVYLVQLNFNNVVAPVVNLLVLLLSIRLVTEKQGRHYLQIFVLALFCLAGSSLLSLSMLYLPALILLIFGVTIGLVLLTFFQRDPSLRLSRAQSTSLLKTAAILPTGSLLLMLGLFFILPRTQFPLWNFLNPDAAATAGFSEQVRPGAFVSSAASKNMAFRAECEEMGAEDLYWRGTVLNTIEGSTWKRTVPSQGRERVAGGIPVTCTITLPATATQFLFTLDRPVALEGLQYQQHSDQVFLSRRPLRKSVSYRCQSRLGGALEQLSTPDVDLYLDVPASVAPRVLQVAERIRQQAETPHQRIALLEEFFRQQQLNYATTDLPEAAAPVDEFLFDKKRGYCEFFASSFALLLRLCEVPTRLVGGYHGGEYNNFGGYYLVTENMAHVWVEALVDGQWQRLDPSRLAANAATTLLASRQQGLSLVKRTLDSLEYMWTQMVITYDLNTQINLVRSSGIRLKGMAPKTTTLRRAGLIILPLLLGGAAVLWWRTHQRLTPQQRLLQRYQNALQQRYKLAHIPPASGLVELALELDDPRCLIFARRYSAMLYGKHPLSAAEFRQLDALVAEIRQGQDKNN